MLAYLRHAAYRERSIRSVPVWVRVLVLCGVLLQSLWHHQLPPPEARAEALPIPPGSSFLRLLSLGDSLVMAKYLNLWLQAFDNQPGISISFNDLDYSRVIAWLGRILELDPRGQYPLLAASRLYADLNMPAKQRQMLNFVHQEFLKDPDRRWPWLAHAAYIAKHRLHDLPLARRYAREIATHTRPERVPAWARQMEIFILEEMGEIESAKILIGGLLESGTITDPHELSFLTRRLAELENSEERKP